MKVWNKSRLIGAHSYSFLAYAAQMGFGFISFMFIVRRFTPELFGWWVLFTTCTAIAEMARTGLIQNGTIRLLKNQALKRAEVATAALVLSILAAFCLSGILVVGAWLISKYQGSTPLNNLFFWYILLSILMALMRFLEVLFIEKNDFKQLLISKSIYGVTFLAGILLTTQLSLNNLVIFQIVGAALATLVLLVNSRRALSLGKLRSTLVLELLDYGRYVMGTNLGSMVFNKIDIIILGSLLGPVAVGFYNAASKIIQIIEVPLTSVVQVIYPKLAAGHLQKDYNLISRTYEQGIGKLMALLLPVCIIIFCFPNLVITLMAGNQYTAGVPILQILIIAVLLKPWGRFFGITLDAIGKPQLNFYFLLGSVGLNITLNILFIPFWGEIGVALATLITIFLNAIIGQIILRRYIPIDTANTLRQAKGAYLKLIKH